MECCCCGEFFRRRKLDGKSSGTESKAFAHNVIKLSRETFLALKLGNNVDSLPKNTRHHKSIVPITLYRSPCCSGDGVDSGDERSTRGLIRSSLKTSESENYGHTEEADVQWPPVKVTVRAVRSEDFNGNKMLNQYVKGGVIGTGSYGKVVLYRNTLDNKLYAVKVIRRSRLRKIRVAPSETAFSDVIREVEIMKKLRHPRIVNLIEIIDDSESDHFYIVLEYVKGGSLFGGSGPPGGIGESNARRYFRDIVEGLIYLHRNNVVHRDVKPENLLLTVEGRIKIGDFSVSCVCEGSEDKILRSPGTPVFTAPECCSGLGYDGKAADVWALGVTLYCMLFGKYPFIGKNLEEMNDKIVNEPLHIPAGSHPDLSKLLEGLFCRDPLLRLKLEDIVCHPWVVKR